MGTAFRALGAYQSERFVLRRPRLSDATAIFIGYGADPKVVRYLGWRAHEDVRSVETYLNTVLRDWASGKEFGLVICPKGAEDDVLGMINLRVDGHQVSFGYVLRRDVWGQGIATEVTARMVGEVLADPAISRAAAFCDVEHLASARVMEKAGMTREGVLRGYFCHPNLADGPRDCILYAKLRGDA